jgi:hypothetical protein
MNTRAHLQRLRVLACTYVHDLPNAARIAAELGTAVAALDGTIFDDGKAIAFATAVLLFATCPGMREHAYQGVEREIADAVRTAS